MDYCSELPYGILSYSSYIDLEKMKAVVFVVKKKNLFDLPQNLFFHVKNFKFSCNSSNSPYFFLFLLHLVLFLFVLLF